MTKEMFRNLEGLEMELENLKMKLRSCSDEAEKDRLLESYSFLYEKINLGYMFLEGSQARRMEREK